jgi:hypothetical protein
MLLVSLKDKLVEMRKRAFMAYFEALYHFCEGTKKPRTRRISTSHHGVDTGPDGALVSVRTATYPRDLGPWWARRLSLKIPGTQFCLGARPP